MKQMLIRDSPEGLEKKFKDGGPDFTVMNAGEFVADTQVDGVTDKTSVCVNFKNRELSILGTQYAGEMKKGFFGIMHYFMP